MNSLNIDGQSPLHYAVCNRLPGSTEVLLSAGADANLLDAEQQSPLAILLNDGYETDDAVQIASLLLRHGANPNCPCCGRKPLHYRAVVACYPRIAELLEEYGAEVGLNAACLLGRIDRIREILSMSPSAIQSESVSDSILADAVSPEYWPQYNSEVNVQILKIILGCGLNVHDQVWLEPVLVHAAEVSLPESVISVLIQHGADVNALGSDGRTPLDVATRRQDFATAKLLLDAGAKLSTELKDIC